MPVPPVEVGAVQAITTLTPLLLVVGVPGAEGVVEAWMPMMLE